MQPTSSPPSALHAIHRWSIEHPYVVVAFYAAIICGAVAAVTLRIPRRFAPYVQSPMLAVVTMEAGLSAEEMETYVSKPVEEQMVNVKDLHYIRSTSQSGLSIVTLEFNYGADMRRAAVDVQALMSVVQGSLPTTGANMRPSFVVPVDPLNLPVLSLSLTGDASLGWTLPKLREIADNTAVRRLKTIPEVNSVATFGGYRRQMQVTVDRDRLAAYHLSILDVRDAIDRQNVSRSAGELTSGEREDTVRIADLAHSADDIRRYPISGTTNAVVRVGDVADVADTYWERRSAFHFLNHRTAAAVTPSIEISVYQDPGASSFHVVPNIEKALRRMEADYPGLHFEAAYDNSKFVNILFNNVWHELGFALLLTAIVIFLFLGEWRGTLIALITLPTALALAILMMAPFGMTFNSGTLIGLLLCIGRIVDDSVIDIHSVERHLRMGKDPKSATIDGIAEVRLAVIASTLMLVLALVPLLFCGGITQQMFVELIWPIIFGLLASMLVSFTLTALLCANWLRPESAREADRKLLLLRILYAAVDPFQLLLARLEASYGRCISRMLTHRFWNLARIAVTVIVGFTFYNFLGSEMMPLADTGQASGILEMQPGTSFVETERAMGRIEKIMLKYPELELGSIEIGAESMFESWNPNITGYQMPQVNAAAMMLTFSDKDRRRRSIWNVMDAVQKEAMATIPGIRRLQIKEMGSDVMATAAAPIHLVYFGDDLQRLDKIGLGALALAKSTAGMVQPATTWAMGEPEYRIVVNRAMAQELGVSPESISQQAYYALHGGLTDEYYRQPNLRQNTIVVRYRPEQRATLEDLEQLSIACPGGRQVPLKSIADIERADGPTVIEHDGLRRIIGVTGYYRRGGPPSMDVEMDLMMRSMRTLSYPPGYGVEMRGDMTQMMASFRSLLGGLVLALVFMYLVLVVQFGSFVEPLQMIASVPLELAGVFTALWLAHQSFSTVSIVGVIVLSGMDMTTAVLLIDMIRRCRRTGVSKDAAIAEACPLRLRPILMTSLITIIVMAPVAFAPRTGLDAYQPLGTTILGGLAVGTILSLFDIPILNSLFSGRDSSPTGRG